MSAATLEEQLTDLLSRLQAACDASGGGEIVVPEPLAKALIHVGSLLSVAAAARADELALRREEDAAAWAALAAPGTTDERIKRAAKIYGLILEDGKLAVSVARGNAKGPGQQRARVVSHYLWLIRHEKKTPADAARVIEREFGFASRKSLRSFLERADLDIREDPDAPERRLPGFVLDDTPAGKPWPRAPQIPLPPIA